MLQVTFNHEAPALTVALETHQQGFPISESYRCESHSAVRNPKLRSGHRRIGFRRKRD